MPIFPGLLIPHIDIGGVSDIDNARTLSDESDKFGRTFAGGSSGTFAVTGDTVLFTDGSASFTDLFAGKYMIVAGSTTSGNDGEFLITNVISATELEYTNAAAVDEPFSGSYSVKDPFSLRDHIDFAATDRRLIKGTSSHVDAIPQYVRPNDLGSLVDKNLTNIVSLDSVATIVSVPVPGVALRPGFGRSGTGAVSLSSEVFTTTDFNFIPGDVGSFLDLTDSTASGATGRYRIKTVTDGQTVTLDGLAATSAGTVDWDLLSSIKAIDSVEAHADSVNRLGIPIADVGAEDQLVYAATFSETTTTNYGRLLDNSENRIFGRTFGDEKDPNSTTASESSRFYLQLLTGENDGTATQASLEEATGKSGSLGVVNAGTKKITNIYGTEQASGTGNILRAPNVQGTVTIFDAEATFIEGYEGKVIYLQGASNTDNNGIFLIKKVVDSQNLIIENPSAVPETSAFTWSIHDRLLTPQDIGRYISIRHVGTDGNQRHAKITAFSEGTATVTGPDFLADANNESIGWGISRHAGTIHAFHGKRVRADLVDEAGRRYDLISGLLTSEDLSEIRRLIGPLTYSDAAKDSISGLANDQSITESIEALATALRDQSIKDIEQAKGLVVEADCLATDVVGDFAYITGAKVDGSFQTSKVDISDPTTMPALGVITEKTTTTRCFIQVSGIYITSSLTPGARYWIGEDSQLSSSVPIPVSGTQVSQTAGVALSETELLLRLSDEIVKHRR